MGFKVLSTAEGCLRMTLQQDPSLYYLVTARINLSFHDPSSWLSAHHIICLQECQVHNARASCTHSTDIPEGNWVNNNKKWECVSHVGSEWRNNTCDACKKRCDYFTKLVSYLINVLCRWQSKRHSIPLSCCILLYPFYGWIKMYWEKKKKELEHVSQITVTVFRMCLHFFFSTAQTLNDAQTTNW